MRCSICKGSNFERDKDSQDPYCTGCGTIQQYENYHENLGSIRGPEGTFVRVGTTGVGSVLAYKDKKIYEATKMIEDITERLNLSSEVVDEVKRMVSQITDGEFGQGVWLSVLIGACCYGFVRREGRGSLSLEEVGDVVGCDLRELGSMVKRVVEFLGLEFREFDLVGLFEKTVKISERLRDVEMEIKERVMKQGVFLMNCCLKWFLSTGRRPMPLVIAVLWFVCQVNGVKLSMEDLVKEAERSVLAKVSVLTCKTRYKELLEKLVKVAHEINLPWADDVNVKNVVKHSGPLLGLMEAKSMRKRIEGTGSELVGRDEFCSDDITRECLSKKVMYCSDGDDGQDKLSRWIDVGEGENHLSLWNNNGDGRISMKQLADDNAAMKQLSTSYKEFVAKVRSGALTKRSQGNSNNMSRRKSIYDVVPSDSWWTGKSKLSQKRLLKEVLEKDVGLDALPPSYIKGCDAVKRRREKIKAAKLRIDAIKHPLDGNELSVELEHGKKKRKRGSEVNWEDLIIQTLVLHNVKDEEIEKGYYKALLDLHVFNSVE